eukprot:UN13504
MYDRQLRMCSKTCMVPRQRIKIIIFIMYTCPWKMISCTIDQTGFPYCFMIYRIGFLFTQRKSFKNIRRIIGFFLQDKNLIAENISLTSQYFQLCVIELKP